MQPSAEIRQRFEGAPFGLELPASRPQFTPTLKSLPQASRARFGALPPFGFLLAIRLPSHAPYSVYSYRRKRGAPVVPLEPSEASPLVHFPGSWTPS